MFQTDVTDIKEKEKVMGKRFVTKEQKSRFMSVAIN